MSVIWKFGLIVPLFPVAKNKNCRFFRDHFGFLYFYFPLPTDREGTEGGRGVHDAVRALSLNKRVLVIRRKHNTNFIVIAIVICKEELRNSAHSPRATRDPRRRDYLTARSESEERRVNQRELYVQRANRFHFWMAGVHIKH